MPEGRSQSAIQIPAPWATRAGEAGLPLLMGIVNVTPDSFSDGGQFYDPDAAVAHGLRLVAEGAYILDIGGESTRPGARAIPVAEELDRVLPLIRSLRVETKTPISIDTRKPEVAEAAIMAGADIWNDVSALTFSPRSIPMAVSLNVPVIAMHAQGCPETMQDRPSYRRVTDEVCEYLKARIQALRAAGYQRPDHDIILDPGIGFGKTLDHNLALLRNLDALIALGHPVMLGASRKSFIAALEREAFPAAQKQARARASDLPPSPSKGSSIDPSMAPSIDSGAGDAYDRLGGSLAAAFHATQAGVSYLRVHDVRETRQFLTVTRAIMK